MYLEQTKRIFKRKLWLDKILGGLETEDGVHIVDDTLNKLQTTLDTINKYDSIQLWLGIVDNERITAARLLYHMQKTDIPIFKVNFSKATFENKIGRIVRPIALHQISASDA